MRKTMGGSLAATAVAAALVYGGSDAAADPCKVAVAPDPSVAVLMHSGSGLVDTPADNPSTALVPIVTPTDCQGGLIDIVIASEGYTQADMARFDMDAALWLDELLSLPPY